MSEFAVSINNLTVAYNNKPVLWNINAHIPSGILLAVAGPNGAGKTTLIKSILELVKPVAGTIQIFGSPYAHQRNQIAYVPQRMSVDWQFPITVFDAVMMGRYGNIGWFKRPGDADIIAVHTALQHVGLTPYAQCHISELSGGQQQRIFLARALVQEASIYLLDEPFIGVDSVTENTTVLLLKKLRDQGKTIIVVHHDLQTIRKYFDWVLLLNVERIAYGTVEQVFTPETVTAAFGTAMQL
ncbi:MAG TPA: metal ABC transporter ATP-binding protein [Candidatus Babeliales bacterium]|nr:metal ABC transporter ATP-binding protein [Candidatus Babeliales bacterium]